MRKILGVACILAITLVIGCKENEPKLESAFGIKFGADIKEVRKEIEKNGEVYDSGYMLNTDNVPDPNPYFSSYTIFADFTANEKVELISAKSKEVVDDEVGFKLFEKIEGELIKKYGEPVERLTDTELKEYSTDLKDIEFFKKTTWSVGIDEIDLSFERLKGNEGKYLSISYHSNNTYEEIKKTIDSKGL